MLIIHTCTYTVLCTLHCVCGSFMLVRILRITIQYTCLIACLIHIYLYCFVYFALYMCFCSCYYSKLHMYSMASAYFIVTCQFVFFPCLLCIVYLSHCISLQYFASAMHATYVYVYVACFLCVPYLYIHVTFCCTL